MCVSEVETRGPSHPSHTPTLLLPLEYFLGGLQSPAFSSCAGLIINFQVAHVPSRFLRHHHHHHFLLLCAFLNTKSPWMSLLSCPNTNGRLTSYSDTLFGCIKLDNSGCECWWKEPEKTSNKSAEFLSFHATLKFMVFAEEKSAIVKIYKGV